MHALSQQDQLTHFYVSFFVEIAMHNLDFIYSLLLDKGIDQF